MNISEKETRKGYLLVFCGAFFISFAAFFVKGAPIDPSMIAFYRLLFGAAALLGLAVLRREAVVPPKASVLFIVLAGLFFACDLLCWHRSIIIVGPGIATIIGNFEVFILAIYGAVFLGDTLSWLQKAAIPLALFGLAMLLGVFQAHLPPHTLWGAGLSLISATFYAGYILALRQTRSLPVCQKITPNMGLISLAACLIVGAYCLGTGVSFAIPDVKTLSILAGLGIVCQSFGWLLLSWGLPLLPPFRAGLILLAQPALSYLWEMLFYGVSAGFLNILGALVTIAAIGMGIITVKKPTPKPCGQTGDDSLTQKAA